MAARRADPPFFLAELARLGVSARSRARLAALLKAGHPGDQRRIYHCLEHSHEVAGLTARMLRSWPRVPADRKVLLIVAASLHDLDPEREPGTPARVVATIERLEGHRPTRAFLAELGAAHGFTPDQVAALVMATDYSARPAEMRAKSAAFRRAHREAFGRDPWIGRWGARLAYWDRIASYLANTTAQSRRRIAGLGRELRAVGVAPRGRAALTGLSVPFLRGLRRDPLFSYLPARDRARFDALVRALSAR